MSEHTQTVEYRVRKSGDQWDHERFREMLVEYGADIGGERTIEESRILVDLLARNVDGCSPPLKIEELMTEDEYREISSRATEVGHGS